MESREERMRQRLRGAGRKDGVEDVSFGPLMADLEDESTILPTNTPTNTVRNSSSRSTKGAKYPVVDAPAALASTGKASQKSSKKRRTPILAEEDLDPIAQAEEDEDEEEAPIAEDELDTLPAPSHRRSSGERISLGKVQEVTESPAHAPGSGQRRILVSGTSKSSLKRLQAVVAAGQEHSTPTQTTSSPLARKSRGRRPPPANRPYSLGKQTATGPEDEDELSPTANRKDELSPTANRKDADRDELEDLAEEITDQDATRVLGRKRPRRSAFREFEADPGPEVTTFLDTSAQEEAEEEPELPAVRPNRRRVAEDVYEIEEDEPASKRRKPIHPSPANRSQPKQKRERSRPKKVQKQARPAAEDDADIEAGNTISVTIQRLIKPRRVAMEEGADDADELNDIAYASSKDPNVVDVLAQSIDEVISQEIEKIKDMGRDLDDSNLRKECKVKIKGLETFGREVKTQLLSHTIKLNYLHQLQGRIRSTERERQKLRDQIIAMRKEQEEIHFRMDKSREEHEDQGQKDGRRVEMSSMMHDVQVAVARGRERPSLSAAKRKQAALANLEMEIAAIADVVCSRGNSGGLARKIEGFNQFLERAEAAIMMHNAAKPKR